MFAFNRRHVDLVATRASRSLSNVNLEHDLKKKKKKKKKKETKEEQQEENEVKATEKKAR